MTVIPISENRFRISVKRNIEISKESFHIFDTDEVYDIDVDQDDEYGFSRISFSATIIGTFINFKKEETQSSEDKDEDIYYAELIRCYKKEVDFNIKKIKPLYNQNYYEVLSNQDKIFLLRGFQISGTL